MFLVFTKKDLMAPKTCPVSSMVSEFPRPTVPVKKHSVCICYLVLCEMFTNIYLFIFKSKPPFSTTEAWTKLLKSHLYTYSNMDQLYEKGDLIQIKTNNKELIEGQFYAMSDDKSRITLSVSQKFCQEKPSDGILHYYAKNIKNIVLLKVYNEQESLNLDQEDFYRALFASKNYIYINQVGKIYQAAIADLKDQSYVALSTDGAYDSRLRDMPFLVLSTPCKTYIFDTQVMQYQCAFDAGLKELLENEVPRKIVHDSRSLSDCLKYNYNVKLHSVFDTQVADLIIMKNKNGLLPQKGKTLNDCLYAYLGVPKIMTTDKYDIIQSTERPLSSKIKEHLAMNIAFHHHLFDVIKKKIEFPLLRGVECYMESLRSCDRFDAWELRSKLSQIPDDFESAIDF